ncbi:hypothetical protein B566_EDAN000625 [Ephemera danica]|nr:hypothetical protein B566_EDAN000625 [Ephemera danica]
MDEQGVNIVQLWNDIDSALVKTVVSGANVLKHQYHLSFPRHPQACFILLGVDVLLDADLKPYVIEVNRSPSLNVDSVIDEEVKEHLLVDTIRLINLGRLDKHRVLDEERRRVYQRTQWTIIQRASRRNDAVLEEKCSDSTSSNINNTIEAQIAWEETHLGNFRKIYPADDYEKYEAFFMQADNSLYQETLASRARKEHLLPQPKTETEGDGLLNTYSGEVSDSDVLSSEDENVRSKGGNRQIVRGRIPILNSFEPQYISMAEERERLRALDKREGLVRALNLRSSLEEALSINGHLYEDTGAISKSRYSDSTDNCLQIRATAAPTWPKKVNIAFLRTEGAEHRGTITFSTFTQPLVSLDIH